MSFKKVETKKKSIYVAEQIIDAIHKGIYKVGDKLPAERQIAEETGVSRPSVREAISALQIVGLVESRSGDGTYIRQPIKNVHAEFRVWSILERTNSPFGVWEARKTLEPGIAELATQTATPEDIETLKKALGEMHKKATQKDHHGFLRADQKFHTALAAATKNPTLQWTIHPLLQNMTHELWIEIKRDSLSNKEHVRTSLSIHGRILSAIESKNKDLAQEQVKRHFSELEKYIFEN
jgi:GntR family transcriptional repressor for pyruvate dehydrogenase complex